MQNNCKAVTGFMGRGMAEVQIPDSDEAAEKYFAFDTQRLFANQVQVFLTGSVTMFVLRELANGALAGGESGGTKASLGTSQVL